MFADENAFYSTPVGSSDFLSSEPRKSLGGLGAPLESSGPSAAFGIGEDLAAHADPFSQDQNASQRGAPSGPAAPQTPDGCVCATVGMLRRAVKARTGGGPLQMHGREVGLIGLCGVASGLDVRASMFKFTLEDLTGKIEVECSNRGALSELQEQAGAPQKEEASSGSSSSSLSAALQGGVAAVYGFACTDDKGNVYVDCFKVNAVTDMREYVELFPLRIIAGALQGAAASCSNHTTKGETNAGPLGAAKEEGGKEEAAMQMYEHISDPAQRAVLKLLLAKGYAVKRQDSPVGRVFTLLLLRLLLLVFAASEVEAALLALEESGDIALTSTWVSLAS
ncbi:hypothetical protein ACSSS7_004055 [Eimeria intestinalis]